MANLNQCTCGRGDDWDNIIKCNAALGCNRWYHYTCEGLTPARVSLISRFACRSCVTKRHAVTMNKLPGESLEDDVEEEDEVASEGISEHQEPAVARRKRKVRSESSPCSEDARRLRAKLEEADPEAEDEEDVEDVQDAEGAEGAEYEGDVEDEEHEEYEEDEDQEEHEEYDEDEEHEEYEENEKNADYERDAEYEQDEEEETQDDEGELDSGEAGSVTRPALQSANLEAFQTSGDERKARLDRWVATQERKAE